MDSRYQYIGDLPTGYAPYDITKIYLRELTALDAKLASKAAINFESLIAAVNNVMLADKPFSAYQLTDGDFEFILALIKRGSFPEAPIVANWHCYKKIVKDEKNQIITDYVSENDIKIRGLKSEVCDTENNTIVYQVKRIIHSLDDDNLYIKYGGIDFPRVATLSDYLECDEKEKQVAATARWIKNGNTLKEKIDILNKSRLDVYENIQRAKKEYRHGVEETFKVFCRGCDDKHSHTLPINIQNTLAVVSEKDVMDIQYTMLTNFHTLLTDDIEIKKLLYFNSCLVKDKKEEQERLKHKKKRRGR